jgi:hypothetical protein
MPEELAFYLEIQNRNVTQGQIGDVKLVKVQSTEGAVGDLAKHDAFDVLAE